MQVPEHIRAAVTAMMDDPEMVGKQVASQIGCSRSLLYHILHGHVGLKTLRRLERLFPNPIDPNLDTVRHLRK